MKRGLYGKMKHILALLLAAVMTVTMVPLRANAMSADYTGKLLDTSISLSVFPVHYIVYEYGGTRADSRDATVGQNYNAWSRMSDADKAKVTKWYAGFTSELKTQFGDNNYQKMLKWANEHNGWENAGNELRNRLANKNYEDLYNYYGEPDNPNPAPSIEVDLTVLSEYSEKEKCELDSRINDYQVAYQEGLEAYQKLIKLKQQQTNVSVTAISSDLIQLIMDNMITSAPLSLGKTLDDLKDAAVDFADQALEISDTLKKTSLYKYSPYGIRDTLTGEDERIDSKEAAQVVAMFWKLLAAREDYANAGYLTCTRMYEDIQKDYGDLVKLDNTRVSNAEASRKAIENAHKKAVEEGVAFLADLEPEINVNASDYYKTDDNGNKVLDTEAYNKARRAAASSWASRQYANGGYVETYNSFVTDMKTFFESGKGHIYYYVPDSTAYSIEPLYTYMDNGKLVEERPDEIYYRIFRKYLRPLEREDQHSTTIGTVHHLDGTTTTEESEVNNYYVYQSAKNIFRTYDNYKDTVLAVEKAYNESLSCLRQVKSQYEAALEAAKPYYKEFITDTQPARNNIYTLCYGVNSVYGSWGLGDAAWNNFQTEYDRDLDTIENRINGIVEMIDVTEAEIDRVEQIQSNFEAEKEALEASLPDTYRVYEQNQKDMQYGLDQYVTGIRKLKELWDSFPEWVNDVNGRSIGETLITSQTLYKESFKGLEKGSPEYMAKIDEILSFAEDIPDTESSYINQIIEMDGLWRSACVKFNSSELYGEIALNNLNAFCGGTRLETANSLVEAYGADEYNDFFKYDLHEKCGGLRKLIKDLKGESFALENMKELYYESLSKRSDWLRTAKTGVRGEEFSQYAYKVGYPYAYNNSRTYSCRTQAENCSYTTWSVEEYYEEYVKPIYEDVEKVWLGEKTYKEVKKLRSGEVNNYNEDSIDTSRLSPGDELNDTEASYSDNVDESENGINEETIKQYYDADDGGDNSSGAGDNDSAGGDEGSDAGDNESDGGENDSASGDGDSSTSEEEVNIADTITMTIGERKQMEVIVEPADATYPELIWESSGSDIADVDGDGMVTAIAPGIAVITATALDSPSDAPISISFKIVVTADENYRNEDDVISEMKESGDTFSLYNESLTLIGNKAEFSGNLLYVGDEYYPPVKILCALYDGDRFVGSSLTDGQLMSGESIKLYTNISLASKITSKLTAKLYLVDDGDITPIAEYSPLSVDSENIGDGEQAATEGAGIYGLSKVDVSSLEEGSTEYVNIINNINLSVLSDDDSAVTKESKVINDNTVDDLYAGARKVRVTYNGAVAGKDYMVMLLTGKTTPSSANIAYVDQKKADGGTVSFDIYPELIRSRDYYIYLSGGTGSGIKEFTRVAGFSGYIPDGEDSSVDSQILSFKIDKSGRCEAGEGTYIKGSITMSDNAEVTKEVLKSCIDSITWESDDQDIVTNNNIYVGSDIYYGSRSAEFTVCAFTEKAGTVNITGTTANGLTASCKFVVNEPESSPENETYYIFYNLNGGRFENGYTVAYTSNTGSFTLDKPVRDGYIFAGWTGSNGAEPETEVIVEEGTTGDLTYNANWKIDEGQGEDPDTTTTYTITYELDGGTVSTANPIIYTADTESFTLNNPVREGYTFAGWTGSNGDVPQTTVTISKGTTGDLTYTANWTADDSGDNGNGGNTGAGGDSGNGGSTGAGGDSGNGGNTGAGGDSGNGGSTGTGDNNGNNGSNITPPATGTVEADKSGKAEYKVTGTDSSSGSVQVSYEKTKESSAASVTVPEKVTLADGTTATVTSISAGAFAGNKKLTGVNIPTTVTTIGDNAFKNCTKLKKVTIPKNVTKIGKNAFVGCSALTAATFKGTKVTEIGNGAFANCKKLKSIVIPKGVKKIGKEAFKNCKKLTKITVKSTTISSIGKNAFKGVPAKAKANVPKKQKKAYQTKLKKAGFKGKVK